jgi:cell division septation protein DedD
MWLKRGAALIFVAALCLALGGLYTVAAQCPGNIAVNPSFEEGFSERGAGEVTIANGWHHFYQDGPRVEEGFFKRPEYKGEDASRFGTRRVHSGNWAQKWFSTFGTHNAGIFQQMSVPAGSLVTASAWAQSWTSNSDDITKSEGNYRLYIGIDPTGGTNFASGSVVWSPANMTTDQWVQLSAQARAQGGTITVFLRGEPEFRTKHNDAYFDDVCVTYAAPPTATPRPTNTPAPTNTPGPTDTPTPTPTPEATATPEPTATPAGARVLLAAFEDLNGDGFRNADEPLMSGALVELQGPDGRILISRRTDAESDPYTVEGLAPGQYTVLVTPAEGYVSPAAEPMSFGLIAGGLREVYVAQQPAPTPTPLPTETPEPTATTATTAPTSAPEPEAAPTVAPTAAPSVSGSSGGFLARYGGLLVAAAGLAIGIPVAIGLLRRKE